MAEKLTKRSLDALRRWASAHPDQEKQIGDTEVPGLYARARRGRVDFFYRAGKGRRTRRRVGRYGPMTLNDARRDASRMYRVLRSGGDLAEDRRESVRQSHTLADAAVGYLDDLRERAEKGAQRGRRSSHAQFERLLTKHVLPRLGHVPVTDVDSSMIRRLHRSLYATPGEANRMLTALSAVMRFAEERELRSPNSNPCRHVQRYREVGERKAVSEAELERLGTAMREAEERRSIHPSALLAIRLLALTGMRRSELLGHESKKRRGEREGLRWGDVDLEAGVMRLRQTKTGAQTRVLGEAALDVLQKAKPVDASDDDPVCPGASAGLPFVGIDRPRMRLYRDAGLKGVDLHSLRHTFASVGAHIESGRHAPFVGPLLGHRHLRSQSITDRYIHANPEAYRPAADAIAGQIAARLGLGEGARVLMFEQPSAVERGAHV